MNPPTDNHDENDQRPYVFGPCRVCNRNKICILFKDCGHLACCIQCSNQRDTCPICGIRITTKIRVYEP